MSLRNLMILFFSTLSVSLVILIIFFSFFFQNVDLAFDTKVPESAPDMSGMYVKETDNRPEKTDAKAKPAKAENKTDPAARKAPVLKTEKHKDAEPDRVTAGVGLSENDVVSHPVAEKPPAKAAVKAQEKPSTKAEAGKTEPKKTETTGPAKAAEKPKEPAATAKTAPGKTPGKAISSPPENPKPQTTLKTDSVHKPVPTPSAETAKPAVKKEDAKPAAAAPASQYSVTVDGFSSRDKAAEKAANLNAGGKANAFVKQVGDQYVVQVGVYGNKANADAMAKSVGGKVSGH
ncbi:MAG: SPOR domain-containing protein [Candidatus Melainabacteria bacterium]